MVVYTVTFFDRLTALLRTKPEIVTVLALLAALLCAVLCARREGLEHRFVYWAGVASLVCGLWGGHLLGILYDGTDGRPLYWLRFWDGGQVQYGALIGGGLAFVALLTLRRLSFLQYADAVAPALALGVSVGRIGCFLNGDDFGTLSNLPWAVRFPQGSDAYASHLSRGWISSLEKWSLPVHPVQLYATFFWLALFIVLVRWHPHQHGLRFSLLLVAHGAGRFVEQLYRGDTRPVIGSLSLTQILSLVLVVIGCALWFRISSISTVNSSHLLSSFETSGHRVIG